MDKTVIYYTSNREDETFEKKMRQTLLETIGELPLISVSQKSIDFGKNICVGDVGASGHNMYRQISIGSVEAKTKFICLAEADFLYPREYFDFKPEREDLAYVADAVWVLFAQRRSIKVFARKKIGHAVGAMIVAKDYLVNTLENMLHGSEMWATGTVKQSDFFKYAFFHNVIPIITFKTDNNMHRKSPYHPESKCRELPYWGKSHDVIARYL